MITDQTPFHAGEVIFFSAESAAVNMMAALLGICETAHTVAAPCLYICDGDDPAQCAALHKAAGVDIPVLFYTAAPAQFTPPRITARYLVLGRPFLFADFRRAAAQLRRHTDISDEPTSSVSARIHLPAVPTIRVENQTAVWQNLRVPLSPCEAGILSVLTEAYPHAAARERLEAVFKRSGSNSVSVYVSYLRKKLSVIPAFRTILSVKDGGFALLMHDTPPPPHH